MEELISTIKMKNNSNLTFIDLFYDENLQVFFKIENNFQMEKLGKNRLKYILLIP